MKIKTCSFLGHRKINETNKLKQNLKNTINDLIVNHNVSVFLFGSRSDFISLCKEIVTQLKKIHPHIKRIAYTCASEGCTLESEREQTESMYLRLYKKEVHLIGVDQEFEHKNKYVAGKASYVERNKAMIDDSDICIFYYDENYIPPQRKRSKKDVRHYQPKSGTKIAYEYAKQKGKIIINLFNEPKNDS